MLIKDNDLCGEFASAELGVLPNGRITIFRVCTPQSKTKSYFVVVNVPLFYDNELYLYKVS